MIETLIIFLILTGLISIISLEYQYIKIEYEERVKAYEEKKKE